MRKEGVTFVLGFILASFSVFAATPREVAEKIPEYVATGLKYILVDFNIDVTEDTSVVFAKFLLLIILMSLLFTAAKKLPNMEGRSFIPFIIALAISILGLQFINKEVIVSVLLPTGAVAVTLAVLGPLIVFSLVLSSIQNSYIRRLGWVLIVFSFIGIWIVRGGDDGFNNWVASAYLIAAILAGTMFFMDGTIQSWFLKGKIKRYGASSADKEISIKKAELTRLTTALASEDDSSEASKIKGQITKVKKQLDNMVDEASK